MKPIKRTWNMCQRTFWKTTTQIWAPPLPPLQHPNTHSWSSEECRCWLTACAGVLNRHGLWKKHLSENKNDFSFYRSSFFFWLRTNVKGNMCAEQRKVHILGTLVIRSSKSWSQTIRIRVKTQQMIPVLRSSQLNSTKVLVVSQIHTGKHFWI